MGLRDVADLPVSLVSNFLASSIVATIQDPYQRFAHNIHRGWQGRISCHWACIDGQQPISNASPFARIIQRRERPQAR
jgi:hypothetical protein